MRAAERPPAAAEIEFSGIETVDSEEAGTTLTWCIHGCVREIMRARFKIRENDRDIDPASRDGNSLAAGKKRRRKKDLREWQKGKNASKWDKRP